MLNLSPQAIVATWMNADKTQGFHLTADGTLMTLSREKPSHAWSPPEVIGKPASSIEQLPPFLRMLTEPAPEPDWF